jgi:Transglycosylase-like domain
MRSPKTFVALGAVAALGGPTAVALAADPAVPTADPAVATPAPVANEAAVQAAAKRKHAHDKLVKRYRHAAHRVDRRSARGHTRWTSTHLRRQIHKLHREATLRPTGVFAKIAACESHTNPRAISASGTYRGMYQFSFSTWRAVGGKGDPARASVGEQTKRAKLLYKRQGSSPWPICGR